MPYREVTMIEVTEVVRLWLRGLPKKRIAVQVGLDPKTVRRYVRTAVAVGITGPETLTEERLTALLGTLHSPPVRPHGEAWARCAAERAFLERMLRQGVRLSKLRRLLQRRGVAVPYPTLHRFAVAELGFGRRAATIPVADGVPGDELQLDTG